MNVNAFRVTFRGEIEPGYRLEEVKSNLAKLFKLDVSNQLHLQKIDRLFSGRTVVIKEGLSKTSAQAYLSAIAKAGGKGYIKIKIGAPDGIEERRTFLRRKQGDRRAKPRLSAILPDRRKDKGRREGDPKS